MEYQRLGGLEITVSRMGLGLAALGRPGYINLGHAQDLDREYGVKAMRDNAHEVLDIAYEHGVRYFDAARSYGRAEAFLGSWIESRDIAPEDLVVGSKWGYTYTADWQVEAEVHEVKEHSRAVFRRQWQESWGTLGPHLDLYQIHSATQESGVLKNRAVLQELFRLKERGVALGLTVSGPGQAQTIEQALRIEIKGQRLFDTVQATWNLLERSAETALRTAHQAGMGVIIKEALANGRLTSRNQEPSFSDKRGTLEEEARRLGAALDGIALAAVLAQPWVDLVLSGAARADHLRSNLSALDVAWDPEADRALRSLAERPEDYWETRSNLPWN